jgi:hypothetical protein
VSLRESSRKALAFVAAAAALGLSAAALAQQETGNLFGTTSDEQGARLPGVAVSLAGMGAAHMTTTDSRGEFRLLNLSPGNWTLLCELPGFARVTKTDVQVAVGKNTSVAVTMKLATVEAAVTVRGEAALLEMRNVTSGAQVTQVELKEIPTARDPWVILQSVSGVLTDRLNIGGDQSSQQSSFVGKGAQEFNNVWNLDGVNITDMAATGGSTMYYDFDSFEEINVTTGGADIRQMTPGVQLNLVTKRGTNDVHGSARFFLSKNQWQSQNLTPELTAQGAEGNSIDQIQDYGVELGGPLWKDRAWLWGAYGRNQVDLFTVTGSPEKTTLENANLKLNIQATDSTALVGGYTQGDKLKFNRNGGLTRPPETTWNQSGVDGKPSALNKVEVDQVVSSKLFLTASYAYLRSSFQLAPVGGTNVNNVYQDSGGVWHNSYWNYRTQRPTHSATATGSYFFNTGAAGHELKFGFSYRKVGVASQTNWPGNGNYELVNPFGSGNDVAVLTRKGVVKGQLFYYNGYAGDVITFGNATINAGLRYDVQDGYNQGGTVPANPVIPDILPGITGVNEPKQYTWRNWQPRVGLTYAVGDARKLLAKASYAKFADQLGISNIFQDNAAALSVIYYYYTDAVGDHVIRRSGIDFDSGSLGHYGFDPANPTSTVSPNTFDPAFRSGTTDEFLGGFDYEILPDLVAGVAYTHRKYQGTAVSSPCTQVDGTGKKCLAYLTSADFRVAGTATGTLFDGTQASQPYYALNDGIPVPAGSGLRDRPDWNSTYDGIELNWQKRLSNKWMMRGNFTWSNWKQHAGPNGCVNPTNSLNCPSGGSDILTSSGINATWAFNVAGLYELPWGFNFGANVYGRQGFPYAQTITVNPEDGLGPQTVLLGKADRYRYANVFDGDVRIEKSVHVKPLQIDLSVDVFNVANSATVLGRVGKVNSTTYHDITRTLSPRIVRAGARVSF